MAIGSIISSIINAADPGRTGKRYLKEAKGLWEDLSLPEYENLITPYLQSTGELSPEVYDAQVSGQFRGIDEDPAAEQMQLRNLGRLEEIAREGMPLGDRLAADEAQRSVAEEGSRAREQILSDMARRGRGGSGAELAAKLASAGDQENMARGMGSDLARQSLERRLSAIGQMGAQAGQFRGQNIGKEAQISQMQNRYNEFLSNLNTQAAANAARQRNLAQEYNLGNQQRIADTNVGNQFMASQARNQQLQQAFADQRSKVSGQTGVLSGLQQEAQRQQGAKQKNVAAGGAGFDAAITPLLGGLLAGAFKPSAGATTSGGGTGSGGSIVGAI